MPDQDMDVLSQSLQSGRYTTDQLSTMMQRSGYTRKEAEARIAQASSQLASQTPDEGKDPTGFMGELYHNAEATGRSVNGAANSLTQPESFPGQNIGRTLIDMVKGYGEETGDQWKNAWQEAKGGSPVAGLVHGLIGTVPAVGPGLNKTGLDVAQGQYQKAGADFLSTLASGLSPEDAVGAASTVAEKLHIHDLGENAVRHQLGFGREQVNPPASNMVDMALREHQLPNSSTYEKFQSILDDSMQKAQNEIAAHSPADIQTKDAMSKLKAAMDHEKSTGYKRLPKYGQLLDMYEEYIDTFGDKVSLAKAQELKQDVWRRLGDADFQKEAAQSPGLKHALLAKGSGLKQAIENETGGPNSTLATVNRDMHVRSALQSRLNEIASAQPDAFSKMAPYIAGTTALTGASAAGLGGAGLHLGMAASGAGLAAVLVTQAMRDPATMMRLGYALNEAGRGRLSQFVSTLPRASSAARLASEGQNNPPTQRNGLQILGLQ